MGLCPTPAVAYLTNVSEAMGGIMISASHNPPEDNGIKLFGTNGTKLSTLLQGQIEAGIRSRWEESDIQVGDSSHGAQKYHRPELLAQYINTTIGRIIYNKTIQEALEASV